VWAAVRPRSRCAGYSRGHISRLTHAFGLPCNHKHVSNFRAGSSTGALQGARCVRAWRSQMGWFQVVSCGGGRWARPCALPAPRMQRTRSQWVWFILSFIFPQGGVRARAGCGVLPHQPWCSCWSPVAEGGGHAPARSQRPACSAHAHSVFDLPWASYFHKGALAHALGVE